MTRHPLPYLVIALLVIAASFVATRPDSATTEKASPMHVSQFVAVSGAPLDPASVPAAGLADVRPVGLPLAPRTAGEPIAEPSGAIGTALIGGYATWFDACRRCAAAGPHLRAMLGPDWRGTAVEVQGPGRAAVTVQLTDACACGERHGLPTLIDLSANAFAELAPLDWGIVAVSIEIGGRPTLPATDTRKEPSRE